MSFQRPFALISKTQVLVLGTASHMTQGRGTYRFEYTRPGGLDYRNKNN